MDETWDRLAELTENVRYDNFESATTALYEGCRDAYAKGASVAEIVDVTRRPASIVRQVLRVTTYGQEATRY